MNVVRSHPLASYVPPPAVWSDPHADLRQLRHQTKNALAVIMMQVSKRLTAGGCPDLAADVERRIMLTAKISNALFGLTQAPAPLAERLNSLCDGLVGMLGDPAQHLTVEVDIGSGMPSSLDALILRATHELVGNAVKHGMHMRLIGRIQVSLTSGADGTMLIVADDGWGCIAHFQPGEGLQLVNLLAQPFGGQVTLQRRGDTTLATLKVPGS
ncbi:MAG: hypothetical protein ACRYHQ_28500 [Janthinobacterium lividum]